MREQLGGPQLSTVKGITTPAKKLPYWLWYIIAKSLGIKLHPKDRPIVSAVLHILTCGSAAGLFVTNAWFSGYNIVSVHTKSDILDGTVSIMLMSFFCGLGVYSHRLAYRLFIHPKFLEMLRLHSKTIVKINTALIILVILVCFVTVLNMSTFSYTYPHMFNTTTPQPVDQLSNESVVVNPCQLVEIPVQVCQVYWASQVVFSLFFLVWNLLVAVVLVSVARTQTINIRRFLKEIEQDALLLDRKLGPRFSRLESLEQFVWFDDDNLANSLMETTAQSGAKQEPESLVDTDAGPEPEEAFRNLELRLGGEVVEVVHSRGQEQPISTTSHSRFRQLEEDGEEETAVEPHIMSIQEMMHQYWRINMSVRLASVALQRWMCSILALVTTFSAIRMVYWLSHTPTLYGVFMFILPLLLLPLLASSYAEVNYEGTKILQSILPTPERVVLFQYLYGQPIQMTVYGHSLTYGTIGTVVAGILAAFSSKILLEEISHI